jgi:hypothetical protein
LTTPERNVSAISMFLSIEIVSERISLFFGSMAIHNQMFSDPTLIIVSSTMNSRIFIFLEDIFFGWYFEPSSKWRHGFLLIKHDSLSETRLNDEPEKYKYRPYNTYFEGVLFLVLTKEIDHLPAIDLSLNEQSHFLY